MTGQISIREGTKKEVASRSNQIPEMSDPHQIDVYEKRMKGKCQLLLVAESDGKPVGFKAGYDKFGDDSFYTWMGGVLLEYRRCGMARLLAEKQEQVVKKEGFKSVQLKTRNIHQNMLIFAISFGFIASLNRSV